MNVVRMDGVTKRYRDVLALDGVSLALAENTVEGLLGRNGDVLRRVCFVKESQRYPDTRW